jgi:hypothetical protein
LAGEQSEYHPDHSYQWRRNEVKTKTVNLSLGVVRRILNLTSLQRMDARGMTRPELAPMIKLFLVKDPRTPYPLPQEEQSLLSRSSRITWRAWRSSR